MDSSKDCLSYATPSRVICKYFISGRPNEVYKMPFARLSAFDDWRYRPENRNKVVVSLHIMYKYDEEFLSQDGRILK